MSKDELSFVDVKPEDSQDYELGKNVQFQHDEEDQPSKKGGEELNSTLKSKGLGWLFDLEEDIDETQGSLVEELDIDFKEIVFKLKCVLLPIRLNVEALDQTPDLWGPLFVVLSYALLLVWGQLKVLSWIIWVWLLGSIFIYFLGKMIGSKNITFSKVFGAIGYCITPLIFAVVLCFMSSKFKYQIFVKLVCVFWSTFSASSMIQLDVVERKKVLLIYPIFLLFLYLISMHTGI